MHDCIVTSQAIRRHVRKHIKIYVIVFHGCEVISHILQTYMTSIHTCECGVVCYISVHDAARGFNIFTIFMDPFLASQKYSGAGLCCKFAAEHLEATACSNGIVGQCRLCYLSSP